MLDLAKLLESGHRRGESNGNQDTVMPDPSILFILQPTCDLHIKKLQPMGSNVQLGCLGVPQPNGAGGSSWVRVSKGFRKQVSHGC